MPIPVESHFVIPDAELEWKFSASGGPGGQHANRSNTRAELTWNIVESTVVSDAQRRRLIDTFGMEIRVVADEHRSQTRNREAAQRRIGERVADALVVKQRRRSTRPSPGSKRRRVEAKRRVSDKKRLRSKPRYDD